MAAAADRLSRVLGREVEHVEPITGGGYTPALRLRLHLADGTTAFAKVATNDETHEMLRDEVAAYERIGARRLVPRVLAAGDGVLALEDLSHARWPPAWAPGDIDRLLATMVGVAATPVPALDGIEQHRPSVLRQWRHADVDGLVDKGVARSWLDRALPLLTDLDEAATFAGDDLLHLDLRSDNLCLLPDRVVLVDWNGACRGQAGIDTACWAPSLTLEGGPQPWDLLPDAAAHHVSLISGYFAARCTQPPIPHAPRVRAFQEEQLRVCLPWISRVLELGDPW